MCHLQVLLLKESCPSAVQYNSSLTKVPEIDEELAKVASADIILLSVWYSIQYMYICTIIPVG